MPNFEFTVNMLQEIPADTVFVSYNTIPALFSYVQRLQNAGHVFLVSPKHLEIAMSRAAAQAIGLL